MIYFVVVSHSCRWTLVEYGKLVDWVGADGGRDGWKEGGGE